MAIVKQAENQPEVPTQLIAQAIKRLGDAAEEMTRSGLTLRCQLVLLANLSGETQKTCQNVLWAMQNLKKTFLVQPKGLTK